MSTPVGGGEERPRSLLAVDGVSFRYANGFGIEDVSFRLGAGQIVVLLGPNGAGKSTLLGCISGLHRPAAGSIRLAGRDLAADQGARRALGIVPQTNAFFPTLTVRENLRAFAELMGVPAGETGARVADTLRRIGLAERADTRADSLSGGMQRLLNLGAGMLHQPAVLLLDEPTVGVDRRAQGRFRQLLRELRERELAILLTTHELHEAEVLADHVVVLADGRLRGAGPVGAVMREAFGERRELQVLLEPAEDDGADDARERAGIEARITRLGLERDARTGAWAGLVDAEDADCAALLELGQANRPCVAQVTLRKPGLGRLIDRLAAGDGA